jgi:PAS domain S-box-containing protein
MAPFKTNLKLAHQGLVLVSIPLVFELVFVLSLSGLQHQTEIEAARLSRSKDILTEVNILASLFYEAVTTNITAAAGKTAALNNRFDDVVKRIRDHLGALHSLTGGERNQTAAMMRFERTVDRTLRLLNQVHESVDKGAWQDINIEESQQLLSELVADLRVVSRKQTETQRESSENERKARRLVQQCVFAGVAVNVLLALALVVYFNKSTAARLKILMENTLKLGRRERLSPALIGTDELAHLDQTIHRMAEELELAIKKERAILDNASDVICSIDSLGNFTAVNPAATDVLGYEPNELIGKSSVRIVLPAALQSTERALNSIIQNKSTGTFENQMKHKDGRPIDTLWSAHWSEDEQQLFCVIHDISASKEMLRVKQQFVSTLSHDLRAPLSSLKVMHASLIKGVYGQVPEAASAKLQSANLELVRLIALINDLLEIEKMESGKLEMEIRDVLIQSVFDQTANAIGASAEEAGIELVINPCDAVIKADERRLVQVMVNLVGNAVKFSTSGKSVVLIACRQDLHLKVEVKDFGRGIPESKLSAIFDRFGQVESADATEKGGTGLGLAICKAIVEQLGGEIGVRSKLDSGSIFWFTVPLS